MPLSLSFLLFEFHIILLQSGSSSCFSPSFTDHLHNPLLVYYSYYYTTRRTAYPVGAYTTGLFRALTLTLTSRSVAVLLRKGLTSCYQCFLMIRFLFPKRKQINFNSAYLNQIDKLPHDAHIKEILFPLIRQLID